MDAGPPTFGNISPEARRQPIPEAYVHGELLMTSTPYVSPSSRITAAAFGSTCPAACLLPRGCALMTGTDWRYFQARSKSASFSPLVRVVGLSPLVSV